MKKVFLLGLIMLLPIIARAVLINGINYKLDSNTHTASVINKTSSSYSGTIVIPASVRAKGLVDNEETDYSVTSIGKEAFYRCTDVTSVVLPNSITSIGAYAFCGSNITTIDIPNSVIEIGSSAFESCMNLTSIVIPNSVTSIGMSAFARCFELTSISLSNGISDIKSDTFLGCKALKKVTIPPSVNKIGSYSFSGCSSLTTIVIPENVTEILFNAFERCEGLSSVTIPSSIQKIWKQIFYNCVNLKSVTCYAEKIPATDKETFKNAPINKAVLYVPSGAIDTYKQATPWKNFKYIVAIGSEPPVDKYKLIYKIDGAVYKTYEIEVGKEITPEEPPVKEGYTFTGWSEIPNIMPGHDVTVTGSFVVNKYKITYMVDDEVYKVIEYYYGEKISPPSRPSGNYATFEWENLPTTMPAHDVTVYAKYTLKEPEPEPASHRMILSFNDGETVTFVLKDKPEITFDGHLFVIKSITGMIEYTRSDIEDFHFEEIETSVESIEYCGEGNVTIYDMNGRMVAKLRNESINSAKMYLNDFNPGMYIIKVGNQKSIKYLKK